MSKSARKAEMKDVSPEEFSKKLNEYAKRLRKANKALVPNESVGQISKSKVID